MIQLLESACSACRLNSTGLPRPLLCWFIITNQLITRSMMCAIIMSHNSNQFLHILQLTLPEGGQTRLRHTVMALNLEPGRAKVIMFGGCPKWQWEKSEFEQQKLAKTAILEFGKQNNPGNLLFLMAV